MPTFDAFLSYSRRDEAFAARLEKTLERYRIPRPYRHGRRRLEVFRDVEDAEIGELTEVLRSSLDDSRYLIVVCSPHARASEYVGLEIAHFAERHGAERILPVLVSGRPDAEVQPDDPLDDRAFPAALREHMTEPLAADFRHLPGESRRTRSVRLREARFQVIARLLGTRKTEELVGRDRRRKRLVRGSLAAFLAVGLGFAGWSYYDGIPRPGIPMSGIPSDAPWAERARSGVKDLREALAASVPDRRDRDRLLVATWCLRRFGRGSGPSEESLAYMAEIISHFDLVALQELSGDDADFEPLYRRLQAHLGRHWKPVTSGVTEGKVGNRERLGFLYDDRKLDFGQFVDEVVLSRDQLSAVGLTDQLARTPFLAGFLLGEDRVVLCNARIFYGSRGELDRRRGEARGVCNYLARVQDGGRLWADHLVLLGNFQVTASDDEMIPAMEEQGFVLPQGLATQTTDMRRENPYDQVLLRFPDEPLFRAAEGGVFDYYEVVFREDEHAAYADAWRPDYEARERTVPEERYFRDWRTYRMSDHLPKWVSLEPVGEERPSR